MPATTRPGASDDSVANPIAASVGVRVNVGMMPVARRTRSVATAQAPSSAITSGPATSPHSTVSTPDCSATRASSTSSGAGNPSSTGIVTPNLTPPPSSEYRQNLRHDRLESHGVRARVRKRR